jgi:hypothetical protein
MRLGIMSLSASSLYHEPAPPGGERNAIEADASKLAPLLDSSADIHVYTRSHLQFAALAKVRSEMSDILTC